jgi:2-iminobutanoate/2-iminopropanoate deaminase
MSGKAHNTPLYRAGDWCIASGITGRIGETLVSGGFEAEIACILEKLSALLAEHDLARKQVAKVTVYLRNIADRDRLNELYAAFFDGHLPARTVVGVNEIARGAQVELEAWVHDPQLEPFHRAPTC